ncbi:unnamed protein product, partial [Linum tenue]
QTTIQGSRRTGGSVRGSGRGGNNRGKSQGGQSSRGEVQPRAFAMTRREADISPEVVTDQDQK